MQEGKTKVIKELGEDAVILSTRNVKDPSDSSNDMIEIIAALDPTPLRKEPAMDKAALLKDQKTGTDAAMESQTSHFIQATSQIYNEIYKLKEIMFEISDSVKYKYSGVLGEKFGMLFRNLMKLGFSEDYSLNLIGKLSSLYPNMSYQDLSLKCKELLFEKLTFSPAITKKNKRQVFAFVGPTGSGKTTALIKLAIISKLVLNGNLMIISTDTQKVGGAEQLQTYSSIASIPYRAVYSPEELKKILSQENDKDFIFIDTTGRNPKLEEQMEEINDFISNIDIDQTFLVLGSNLTKNSYLHSSNAFTKLGFSSIILSKADESDNLGEFFEFLNDKQLPVSYISTGQQVPEDIEPASKQVFGKYLFKDVI